MATRRATLKYTELYDFYADHEEHLKNGFCFLSPGAVRGELAPEIKLDITIPIIGRLGPFQAQVIQRAPDGSYGLQVPDFQSEARRGLKNLEEAIQAAETYLARKNASVEEEPAASSELIARLESRIVELEAQLAERVAGRLPAQEPGVVASVESGTACEAADGAQAGETPIDGEPAGEAETVAIAPAAAVPPESESAAGEAAPVPSEVVRGIPLLDVSNLEPSFEGLTEANALRMGVMEIAASGATGLFTLHQDDGVVRYAYFKSGGPVAWRTVPLQEREVLGMLLFKAGQITKEQLERCIEIMQTKGIRQGEAFIEMGIMSFSQLIMVLGKQNEFILQHVLKHSKGSWTFHPLPKLPEAFLPPPVRVGALLFRSMIEEAKQLRGQRLADTLREYVNNYVQIAEGRQGMFGDLGLNSAERRLVAIIQERTIRMRELFSMSPLSRQNTAAVFYALISLGMFSFGNRETHARYLQRIGIDIGRKKRQLIQATHFDVLEVHWISLPEEIEEGYHKLKEEYRLESYVDVPDDLAETIQRINKRVDEAYAVLRDALQRREYRKTLVEEFMIIQSAELLAKKGEMAVMRQERMVAVSCFAKALELQPRNGAYKTSLQRARAV
ncbi:MAG: hypothetical protein CL927_18950 [Deltaproteobacteria bacterium]|nr:hypothetical protein [Deltaproteobacteria bacterium]HCH65054.1 hypothetical protein [Deltaproteobacteria bacterium]